MKDYKQYYIIPEEPEFVYKAILQENTFKLWTGKEAEITMEVGTEFALFDDSIHGQNLHFEEFNEIVQQWYLQEIEKAEDASIVSIKLFPHKKGTSLLLEQNNIPDEMYDGMIDFWESNYMKSLIDFYK
ncbi:MAG: SRPBCC domain-containing protein [Chitinophagales bacterium]